MVAMFISGIVVAGVSTFLVSMTRWATQASAAVSAVDQDKLAVGGIDRQVTSALTIYDPSTEGADAGQNADGTPIPAGFSLRVYTESNGSYQCEQWRLLDTGQLQSRTWQPYWTSGLPVTPWSLLASGIDNPASDPPFLLDTSPGFGGPGTSGAPNNGRLLDIVIVANASPNPGGSLRLTSSVDGRDIGYLPTDANACSTIPPA